MAEIKAFFSSPLGQVFVETLRWAICGIVAQLLLQLPQLEQTTNIVVLTAVLRFVDAALHKSGVAQKGLVRF